MTSQTPTGETRKWKALRVEVYGPRGYEGHWEVTPPVPDQWLGECDRAVVRQQLLLVDRYRGAQLDEKLDGNTLVVCLSYGRPQPSQPAITLAGKLAGNGRHGRRRRG